MIPRYRCLLCANSVISGLPGSDYTAGNGLEHMGYLRRSLQSRSNSQVQSNIPEQFWDWKKQFPLFRALRLNRYESFYEFFPIISSMIKSRDYSLIGRSLAAAPVYLWLHKELTVKSLQINVSCHSVWKIDMRHRVIFFL